jgi:hypothetical protein
LVRRPQRKDRNFAGKVHAFNDGLARVQSLKVELIGNLDAARKSLAEITKILMPESTRSNVLQKHEVMTKATIINGVAANAKCIEIRGQRYGITRGLVSAVGLEDDWYEDVNDPYEVINTLSNYPGVRPDIFTFWQRLPNIEPKYEFHMECESIAALRIESYDYWLNRQIKGTARNMIRKSQKAGVEVKEADYDDDFVRGMVNIFNETPMRQGRRFFHYGKDFGTVKCQFSRFLFREDLIGAYYRDELIGFVMLGNAGQYGVLGQIISLVRHRDKATNNALMAKSVEVCERKNLPYLVYGFWCDSSLTDFKRYSGFKEVRLPRYFVPITQKGKFALRLGLHRGWKAIVPDQVKNPIKGIRRSWYTWKLCKKKPGAF